MEHRVPPVSPSPSVYQYHYQLQIPFCESQCPPFPRNSTNQLRKLKTEVRRPSRRCYLKHLVSAQFQFDFHQPSGNIPKTKERRKIVDFRLISCHDSSQGALSKFYLKTTVPLFRVELGRKLNFSALKHCNEVVLQMANPTLGSKPHCTQTQPHQDFATQRHKRENSRRYFICSLGVSANKKSFTPNITASLRHSDPPLTLHRT